MPLLSNGFCGGRESEHFLCDDFETFGEMIPPKKGGIRAILAPIPPFLGVLNTQGSVCDDHIRAEVNPNKV